MVECFDPQVPLSQKGGIGPGSWSPEGGHSSVGRPTLFACVLVSHVTMRIHAPRPMQAMRQCSCPSEGPGKDGTDVEEALDRILSWQRETGSSVTGSDTCCGGLQQVGLDKDTLRRIGMEEEATDRLQRHIYVYASSLCSVIADAMGETDKKKETSLRVAVAVHHVVSNLLRGAGGTPSHDRDVVSMLLDRNDRNQESKMSMIMRCKALEVDVQQWKTRCWEEGSRSQSLEENLLQKEETLRAAAIESNECRIVLERREMEIRRLAAELEIVKRNQERAEEHKQQLKDECLDLARCNRKINSRAMSTATMLGGVCGALNKILSTLTFRTHQEGERQTVEGDPGDGDERHKRTSLLDLLDALEAKMEKFSTSFGVLEGKTRSLSQELRTTRALNAQLKVQIHALEDDQQVLRSEREENRGRIGQMSAELEQAATQRDSIAAECKSFEIRAAELEQKHQDCARQQAHLLRERHAMKKGLAQREADLNQLRRSNARLAKRCEENDQKMIAGVAVLDQSQAQMHAYKAQCEELSDRVDDLLQKLAESQSTVHHLQAKQEEMHDALRGQESVVQEMHERVGLLERQLQAENARSEQLQQEGQRAREAAEQAENASRSEIATLQETVEQHKARSRELQEGLALCTECTAELGALKGQHRQVLEDFAALSSQLEASHAIMQRLADLAGEVHGSLATTANALSSPLEAGGPVVEDVENVMHAAVRAAHHCSEAAAASREGLLKAHSQLEVASQENAELSSAVARLRSAVHSEVRARKFRERFASRLHMDLQEAQRALSNLRLGYGSRARHAQQQTRGG